MSFFEWKNLKLLHWLMVRRDLRACSLTCFFFPDHLFTGRPNITSEVRSIFFDDNPFASPVKSNNCERVSYGAGGAVGQDALAKATAASTASVTGTPKGWMIAAIIMAKNVVMRAVLKMRPLFSLLT